MNPLITYDWYKRCKAELVAIGCVFDADDGNEVDIRVPLDRVDDAKRIIDKYKADT